MQEIQLHAVHGLVLLFTSILSVESSSFGSEFIAMKQCCEYL